MLKWLHILVGWCLISQSLWSDGALKQEISQFEAIQQESLLPQLSNQPVQVELLNEEESIQAGHPFWVAARLKIDPSWHAYWKNPGDIGFAPSIEWYLPKDFQAGPIQWPVPERFGDDSLVGFGYQGEVWFLTQIIPPDTLFSETPIEISADVRWLVCSDSNCLPGNTPVLLKLPISSKLPQTAKEWEHGFEQARALLPKKQWSFQAQQQGQLIELAIQIPGILPFVPKSAYFFPEDKQIIDHKTEAVLSQVAEMANRYLLLIKGSESQDIKAERLRGVLVLKGDLQAEEEALEIDIPIKKSAPELISMADSHELMPKPVQDAPGKGQVLPIQDAATQFEGGSFGWALVFAFVGGMILNLMPCVLPVVSLKVLNFVQMAGQSRSLTFKHGLAFSLGVLVSFWFLSVSLLILQAYGRTVGWGFQLQEPIFVAFLAAVLVLLGLSLFGLFELGTSVTSWAGQAQSQSKSGLSGSFLSGVLATAVATPCTGPFLGSAIGIAVTMPPFWSILIFTSLGLGMAFPYLALSAFPSLLRFLPKPGAWMVTFKELMGFLMFATVLWLIWVFGAQTNHIAVVILLIGFFFLALAGWIYGKWGTPMKSRWTRLISVFFTFACLLAGSWIIWNSTADWVLALEPKSGIAAPSVKDDWEEFSPARLAELRQQGVPVFVDFTAKWCLICQANHLVLSVPEVYQKLSEMGVVKMKADWTRNDSAITQELRKFGRSGVPLYLLYGKESNPKILPQVLTPEIVMQELRELESIQEI